MRNLLIVAFLLTTAASYGQRNGNDNERIEALKIAFITQKLSIKSSEAEKFWPVYNAYQSDVKKIPVREGDVLKNEERLLNIRKKYRPRFASILGDERANQLYNVEKDFRNVLIRRLKSRDGKNG